MHGNLGLPVAHPRCCADELFLFRDLGHRDNEFGSYSFFLQPNFDGNSGHNAIGFELMLEIYTVPVFGISFPEASTGFSSGETILMSALQVTDILET